MVLRIIMLIILCGFGQPCLAVDLPAVIADGMVLQRQAPVPIWGWGKAGDAVSVSFAGETVKGSVKTDGRWCVYLKPLEASSVNQPMTITVGADSITLNDVVVGEVWLASGQSNMQVTLDESSRKTMDPEDGPVAWAVKEELTRHFDPLIRQLKVPTATSYDKELSRFDGIWAKADSQENKHQFSAVGYYFAKELRTNIEVPVGIIVAAWGAKKIQPFIPSSQYKKNPAMAKYYNDEMARMKDRIAAYDPVKEDARYKAILEKWRERVKKAEAAGKWPPRQPRQYFPQNNPNFPSTIYNAMINPLVPYAIRGVIWYQGESNCKYLKANVFSYDVYLRNLADGWRDRFGQGDFPIYYCQLAQFRTAPTEPVDSNDWVTVCNDMRKALNHKNMGMAVLNDCGEVRDIHPRNKIDAGKRLALWALARDYGHKDLIYSGPLYRSHAISSGKATIQFDSVGDGLMTARKHLLEPAKPVDEELQGFQICGKDRQWKWAKAKITGKNSVEVWHPDVTAPDEVRYAWASNPANANLYNKAGLPTSVFSTK
jgi:sialate O-acetylesterase